MTVTTLSSAVQITPVVIKTLLKHYKTKGKKFRDGDEEEVAFDDIFFDEGFHIVKSFIEFGTYNTVESLQAFTNTHVPASPWAAVIPVKIPFSSCNAAADMLIYWFGPDELKHIVGGAKWWQVRGLDGVDAEWISEKEFLRGSKASEQNEKKKCSQSEERILKMERLESVMLYVHGGAYFWGSINSHRYQIIRYARKFRGRAFAVNYRKAPQYPWPCPLHDVLAAYLYLTHPPPNAFHKPVSPSKIVLAGDSAGGGLCLAVLTVLRDLGIQLPAGAVLISPWIDLTHSFSSIMENTESDITPPHGFIAKPSATWPVDLKRSRRVSITVTMSPPAPGHADTLNPDPDRVTEFAGRRIEGRSAEDLDKNEKLPSQAEMLARANHEDCCNLPSQIHGTDLDHTVAIEMSRRSSAPELRLPDEPLEDLIDRWQPKPPKVLMENLDDTPLELGSQMQLYATTEQLTHPLVSPVLQGSLGNLCPLYIMAGDGELLRDEIIYIAHKAAHPDQYPAREGALRGNNRQRENAKKYTTPTKVHLQVFDGMCHVLTVFSYTDSAKYAYRSIAQFVKHVTQPLTTGPRRAFPAPIEGSVANDDSDDPEVTRRRATFWRGNNHSKKTYEEQGTTSYKNHTQNIARDVEADNDSRMSTKTEDSSCDESGIMIRERVDIHGKVRPMESEDKLPALQMPPVQVGIIKEAPVRRWLAGQEAWDRKYARTADKVLKRRRKIETKAALILAKAREGGLMLSHELEDCGRAHSLPRAGTVLSATTTQIGIIDPERRWGPLDLEDENPPPTAIAKRRDTPEALALLRKTIYHSAPVTHIYVPERRTMDIIRAIFDPDDHPVKAPRQSVSEQQIRKHIIPMHGMRIWDVLVGYFMRKKAKVAETKPVAPVATA